MRKVDENQAQNYIKKHRNHKRWIAFALCVALITGSTTLYMLNKPATAMTEEGAENVGLVLETADSEYEQGLIEKMEEEEQAAGEEKASEGSEAAESEETSGELSEAAEGSEDAEGVEKEAAEGEEKETAEGEEKETSEEAELKDKEDAEETEIKNKEDVEGSEIKNKADAEGAELKDKEKADKDSGKKINEKSEKTDEKEDSKLKESEDEKTEFEEDVVLTASYVDTEGNSIADDKEMNISESFDPATEASEIEGYKFKEASIDGEVITLITALKDEESEHKFFEVTLDGGDAVKIKEDKTVVLTYSSLKSSEEEKEEKETEKKSVVLTAKYVDKDGEEIKEPEEISFNEETELKKDNVVSVEGFFYRDVTFEDKKITKITPVLGEEEIEENEKEAKKDSEASETENLDDTSEQDFKVKNYIFTTVDGEELQVDKDSEIIFNYAKATDKTEFVFEDSKVTVKAITKSAGVFPEGTQIKVTAVDKATEGYNYDAYMEALNTNAKEIEKIAAEANGIDIDPENEQTEKKFDENNTLLYDIAFMYDEMEFQPAEGAISISIEFKENKLTEELAASNNEDIAVVHLPIKEEVKKESEIATTEEATDIKSEDIEVITLMDASAEVGSEHTGEKVEFSADSFSIFAVLKYQTHASGTDTYETVLGDAVNFGVIANEFTQIEHAETNFAAIKFSQGGKTTGNDMTNPVEQTFIASEIVGNITINGEPSYFVVPKEYKDQISSNGRIVFDTSYSHDEIKGIVEDMLTYIRAASRDLATRSQSDYLTIHPYGDQSKKCFDFSSFKDGTYYLNVDKTFIDDYLSTDEKLFIKKNPGQTIVFNVTYDGEIEIHKYMVDNNDGAGFVDTATLEGRREDPVARTLIWNFINSPKVTSRGSVAGVFISGRSDATWENLSTSGGWVAFEHVDLPGGGEWHNTFDKIRQISGTAEFQAYKTIDGVESTVSGFEFTLYKEDATSESGWKAIETKTNNSASPHSIVFSPITYGDNTTITSNQYQYVSGDSATFTYKIVETQGLVDENNNSYAADTREYYATVDVVKENYSTLFGRVAYNVSAPKYYYLDDSGNRVEITQSTFFDKDGNEVDAGGLPVFNNKASGSVGFNLEKFIDERDPSSEYSFTVRVLKKNVVGSQSRLVTATDSLVNKGKNLTYSFTYDSDYIYNTTHTNQMFFVVNENPGDDSNTEYDGRYIIIRVDFTKEDATGKEKPTVYYYVYTEKKDEHNKNWLADEKKWIKYLEENNSDGNLRLALDSTKTKAGNERYAVKVDLPDGTTQYNEGNGNAAFYNKTKTTMLRIHKMVINNFGKKKVTGMLDDILFKVTNTGTGKFILVDGENRSYSGPSTAVEYDDSGNPTSKTYNVYYNQCAQWTIKGLPEGNYKVEEVADGETLKYENGESKINESSRYSRVTKYEVTFDQNNDAEETNEYQFGGDNKRIVFSADLKNQSNDAPTVSVGGEVPTVQICNYYSIPIGPIEVSKNFSGGTWGSDMEFEFEIAGIGYSAVDPQGNAIKYEKDIQPMPENTTAKVDGSKATKNTDGSYSGVAEFGNIPFKYKGTYNYVITEKAGNYSGVSYDSKKIYVVVEVSEKHTTFTKDYSTLVYPNGYGSYAKIDNEDLYYLGADVTYYGNYNDADQSFSEVLGKCRLTLGVNPKTGNLSTDKFIVTYSEKTENIAFHNTISGKLTIKKEWRKIDGTPDTDPAVTALDVVILRKTAASNWEVYRDDIQIFKDRGWIWESDKANVPIDLVDESGNKYIYTVKEKDNYLREFSVKYNYGGKDYLSDMQGNLTWIDEAGQSHSIDGYPMVATGVDYGIVTISNQRIVTNTLPSTGGIGDIPYLASGIGVAVAGLLGGTAYSRKKKKDEQEEE